MPRVRLLIPAALSLMLVACSGATPTPTPVPPTASLVPPTVAAGSIAPSAAASPVATSPSAAPSTSTGSTTITVKLVDYAFEPSVISVPAGEVTFALRNDGTQEHEFEIFKGDAVVDEAEGLIPGLERDLVVTLAPGDYTFVCKLADHEARGMTGTLTVTAA